jgi:hypothetical protein
MFSLRLAKLNREEDISQAYLFGMGRRIGEHLFYSLLYITT